MKVTATPSPRSTADADPAGAVPLGLTIDDLTMDAMQMVRADGRRLVVVRTATGAYALDAACPHEGYGLTKGELSGDVLTCAWHNWKFDVTSGSCLLGEEAVQSHDVVMGDDGALAVVLAREDPDVTRPRLLTSLRDGLANQRVGQMSRDVVRLLRADANPGELVWEAVSYGAPRAEFGWGHSIASATDCIAMIDLYEGDQRALPIVQALAGVAETERRRPVNPLPSRASDVPVDAERKFRALVQAERLEDAQALVLGALHRGDDAATLRRWFTSAVSDHHLSYGHAAIYAQKAFQLLEAIGWDRAETVLAHLVPSIVYGTREDTLPYMRPFTKVLGSLDLATLADVAVDPHWRDDGALRTALLADGDRAGPVRAAVDALTQGAGIDGVLDAVSLAVSERMLRYDTDGEFDFHDDFGWLDITHGLTYANAARWHAADRQDPDVVRLAMWCVFQAHWTGRHEWHSTIGETRDAELPPASTPGPTDVVAASTNRSGAAAGADDPAGVGRLQQQGEALQRRALDDGTTAAIVHAHAVKTTRAATLEAVTTGSDLPLRAAARFLDAPKLERFVAATVTRSIDFVAGRTPRPD